eukprot:921874-Amphidinium_carterae.1
MQHAIHRAVSKSPERLRAKSLEVRKLLCGSPELGMHDAMAASFERVRVARQPTCPQTAKSDQAMQDKVVCRTRTTPLRANTTMDPKS